jgi:hypothetical protein
MRFVDFIYLLFFFPEFVYGQRVVACGALFGMRFVRFFLLIIFFPEFVYGLSHVGLYLGWNLSDFIYLLLLFLNLCMGWCFFNFFF